MQRNEGLAGKVVLITGASSGIGRETAYKFAVEGARLALTYNKGRKAGEETARKCMALGSPEALLLKLDVASDKSIRACVKKVISKFGAIDVLVNNAGVLTKHKGKIWIPFGKISFKDIEAECRANLEGLMKLTHAVLPHVREAVLNIASGASKTPYSELVSYCATKYGVRGFSQSLALGYPKLRVYCVNPGTTATRMTNYGGVKPERVAQVILNAALGKYKVRSGGDIDVWEYLK